MNERTRITIDLNIKTKTMKVLKKLYDTQKEIGSIGKDYNTLDDVAKALVDDILVDVRLNAKDAIKKAIIDYKEEIEK